MKTGGRILLTINQIESIQTHDFVRGRNPTTSEIRRLSRFYFLFMYASWGRLEGWRSGAERPPTLFPPTSPPSNGPGWAPEATDRLDIVAGDY